MLEFIVQVSVMWILVVINTYSEDGDECFMTL